MTTSTSTVSEAVVSKLEAELLSDKAVVTRKYRALFALRNVASATAVRALERCLLQAEADDSQSARESSALLKHEVAYALGQVGLVSSIPTLERVLGDAKAHPMVRHEAGEALGAMGAVDAEPILARFVNDPVREVAETCQLALDRIAFFRQSRDAASSASSSRHTSVDPAPPLAGSLSIDELLHHCMDNKQSLFHRYRAMFSLRDRASGEAALALCECFDDESALFKHEVAFVLGQMQRAEAAPRLRAVLRDKSENIMVRHEAAEALGALTYDLSSEAGGDETLELLRAHAHDDEAVVAHSALVALDIADYNISDEFQYALTAESLAQQTQPPPNKK